MNIYNVEYIKLMSGEVVIHYKKHDDDDKYFRPTYEVLKKDMQEAQEYIKQLSAKE